MGGLLPVIVWDAEARRRGVVEMRWGGSRPRDWRRPRPIHARSDTIDAKEPFRTPFHAGQRGIVVFRTFNDGEEVVTPSAGPKPAMESTPRTAKPRGFAFVWRRFAIKSEKDDPRMSAILEDAAWSSWLGEDNTAPAAAKGHAKDDGRRKLAGCTRTKEAATSHASETALVRVRRRMRRVLPKRLWRPNHVALKGR